MKKGVLTLLILSLCGISLMIGILIGRNCHDECVVISQNDVIASTIPLETLEDSRLDINSATVSQLMELPGIGETIAQRIVDYRKENGKFYVLEDLLLVEGIGEKKLQAIKALVKVGG